MTRDAEILKRFTDSYSLRRKQKLFREIECEVIGCGLGANGYTTQTQAKTLARKLALSRDSLLLDFGCGQGWPGLFLVDTTGCRSVLTNRPASGLLGALDQARRLRISRRVRLVQASGPELPFAAASFDAIVHTDVLCCLLRKQASLATCHRLLRPGGRMAFYTIFIAPDATSADRRRATKFSRPALATRSSYPAMLHSAGFSEIEEADVTSAFRRTHAAWSRGYERRAAELGALEGKASFEERMRNNGEQLRLIDDGIMRRSMFVVAKDRRRRRT